MNHTLDEMPILFLTSVNWFEDGHVKHVPIPMIVTIYITSAAASNIVWQDIRPVRGRSRENLSPFPSVLQGIIVRYWFYRLV